MDDMGGNDYSALSIFKRLVGEKFGQALEALPSRLTMSSRQDRLFSNLCSRGELFSISLGQKTNFGAQPILLRFLVFGKRTLFRGNEYEL